LVEIFDQLNFLPLTSALVFASEAPSVFASEAKQSTQLHFIIAVGGLRSLLRVERGSRFTPRKDGLGAMTQSITFSL